MDLESVVCPVSGVEYRCIHGDRVSDVQHLQQWVRSLQSRFERGEIVSIAMDCEGYFLSQIPNSGLAIQLGEVFEGGYRIGDLDPPPVAPKPGVIVFFPLSDEVKRLLQVIFESPMVQLITFDFTNDIALILEAGISVRYESIIDCQLVTASKFHSQITNVRTQGIASFIKKAPSDIDPLMDKANSLGKQEIKWDAIFYVIDKENRDPLSFVDRGFLEYAACDITLTGLVCAIAINLNMKEEWLARNQQKIEEFQASLSKGILNPCLNRRHSFFLKYRLKKYGKLPKAISTQEEILSVLEQWRDAYCYTRAMRDLHIILKPQRNHKAILRRAEQLLNPHMSQVKALALL